jgi:hypothetical protein
MAHRPWIGPPTDTLHPEGCSPVHPRARRGWTSFYTSLSP